jgi:hypothetical protein
LKYLRMACSRRALNACSSALARLWFSPRILTRNKEKGPGCTVKSTLEWPAPGGHWRPAALQ